MFLDHWDNLLRIAGSLKKGWVTASLLISKLQAYPQQNILTQALQEYGRLVKTIVILSYLERKEDRRHINAQLNKGESIHSLRQAILYANDGKIRKSQDESQTNQVLCLNLMTNAVITWNTVYMQAVIDQLKREGDQINEDDLRHISPARYEHINLYGKFSSNDDQDFGTDKRRPLRTP